MAINAWGDAWGPRVVGMLKKCCL